MKICDYHKKKRMSRYKRTLQTKKLHEFGSELLNFMDIVIPKSICSDFE